jgi:hypothetical protein
LLPSCSPGEIGVAAATSCNGVDFFTFRCFAGVSGTTVFGSLVLERALAGAFEHDLFFSYWQQVQAFVPGTVQHMIMSAMQKSQSTSERTGVFFITLFRA